MMAIFKPPKIFSATLALISFTFLFTQLLYVMKPGFFWTGFDEATYFVALKHLVRGEILYHQIFHSQLPLFIYTGKFFTQLFGLSLASVRWGTAVVAAMGIPAAFLLGAELIGPSFGLLLGLLLAFNSDFFHASHNFTGNAPAVSIAIWSVYFTRRGLRSAKKIRITWIFLSGVFMAIAMQYKLNVTGIAAWLGLLVVGAGWKKDESYKRNFSSIFAYLAGILLAHGLVLAQFDSVRELLLQQDSGNVANLVTGSHPTVFTYTLIQKIFLFFINDWYNQPGQGGNAYFPALFLLSIPLAFWSRYRPLVFLNLSLACVIFMSVMLNAGAWPQHYLALVPSFCFLQGLCVYEFWKGGTPRIPTSGRIFFAAGSGLALFSLAQDLNLNLTPLLSAQFDQKMFFYLNQDGELIDDIKRKLGAGDQLVTDRIWIPAFLDFDVPANLVDVSNMRIRSRALTCDDFLESLENTHVKMIATHLKISSLDCSPDPLFRRLRMIFPFYKKYKSGVVAFSR